MRLRLHVPAAAFVAGTSMALPAAAARHVQVLRLQPGATVVLFDGSDDLEWQATIQHMGRSDVEVRLEQAIAVQRELPWHVTLALGVPANDRMDALVEKAGELGAAALQPLLCERSVLRLAGERADAKRRHWSGVAAAASEQCGRVRVTELLPMRPVSAWLHQEASASVPLRLVLSFDAAAVHPDEALANAAAGTGPRSAGAASPRPRRAVVLSGPEGGLSGAEEEAAVAVGFVRTSLGPRVLRADTAPLALLAWLGLQR